MIDIKNLTEQFAQKVERTFGERAWFIGLQGSYARGEAGDSSDIDFVVILDELRINDLNIYRDMLDTLPHRELVCGFVSGKAELLNWETSDLFQFCYDTVPVKGSLDDIIEKIDRQAIKRAIRIGACNIYHACVHNYVHERSGDILRSLYKSATFVIRAVYFYETGKYVKPCSELLRDITPPSAVLETASALKNGKAADVDGMSELLFGWAQAVINGYCE